MGLKGRLAKEHRDDETPVSTDSLSGNVDNARKVKADPFPTDLLPRTIAELAGSVSESVGVDTSFAVLPMLSVASTAIGNSRYVSTKDGNQQPLMLWTAVVGHSGTQKSEPYSIAESPLREVDAELIQKYQAEIADYETAEAVYRVNFSDWKKIREGEPPRRPPKPVRKRILLTDFSYEAMVESHAGSPRGLMISCEELSAWFGSFERYCNSGVVSGEQSRFLQAYDGRSITTERVSSCRFVPRPFINVSGTIQPGILARCFTSESRENGLASRLWLSYPASTPIRWSDKTVSNEASVRYRELIRALMNLRPASDSDWPEPRILTFSRDSQKLFADFMTATGSDAFAMTEDRRAAAVKFIGRCARISGIIHCCETVGGEGADSLVISPSTVERAIGISQWAIDETHRIYELLQESEETRALRQVADWIQARGGAITARDMARYRRDIVNTEAGELVLMRLVAMGLGNWQPIHKSRKFVLS